MEVASIVRTSVSQAVVGQLANEILSGKLKVGEPLPSERELAESFGVNRHAIREALKLLQQTGLVKIVHGGRTRVLDWRVHAGLDVLIALGEAGGPSKVRMMHDICVMRQSIGADAARLCAERATPEQKAMVLQAAQSFPEGKVDDSTLIQADVVFWNAVILGSGNIAYRLALNTLVKGFDKVDPLASLEQIGELTDRDAHIALARLIGEGDGEGARLAVQELLGRVVKLLAALL
ncbi:MAG: FadR/GntR family transcriptional regulator [Mycobacteriaceae bacterium]